MLLPRMRELRTDHDLSQKKMGEILHIGQRTYSHYETGSRDIPLETLIRFAAYFDVSLDYLAERTDEKKMNVTKTRKK